MPTLGKFPMPPPVPRQDRRQPAKKSKTTSRPFFVRPSATFWWSLLQKMAVISHASFCLCLSLAPCLCLPRSFCQFSIRWRRFGTWKKDEEDVLSGVDFWVRACVKTRTFYVAPPREFPLSVRATFKRELQIFTHKFTPLSIVWLWHRRVEKESGRHFCISRQVVI